MTNAPIRALRYPDHAERCGMKKVQGIGFGVSPTVVGELDAIAEAKGISRSEAARTALAIGIPMLKLGVRLNADRALTILEHTQLALSLLVERQYPEDVDELVDLAVANMRKHHA